VSDSNHDIHPELIIHLCSTIESNLDCVILAPQLNVQEYLRHAHRPIFKHLLYRLAKDGEGACSSKNLRSLQDVVATLDIDMDPYVENLRKQLGRMTESDPLRARVDQKLSKAIKKQDTYTHKGLRDFQRAADDIYLDVGPWGADWYIEKVISRVKDSEVPYKSIITDLQQEEKRYMLDIIKRINVIPSSYDPPDIIAGITDKVLALIECLQEEMALTESRGEVYSCLVFVTRRDSVLALSEVLRQHPQTKNLFNIGSLLGASESQYRRTFLDITRDLALASQVDTLRDFRIGEKNLIVSTSVAEEGIDIQACGTVIRWDPPQNMVSPRVSLLHVHLH
jgi:endoribonuclease Dicer